MLALGRSTDLHLLPISLGGLDAIRWKRYAVSCSAYTIGHQGALKPRFVGTALIPGKSAQAVGHPAALPGRGASLLTGPRPVQTYAPSASSMGRRPPHSPAEAVAFALVKFRPAGFRATDAGLTGCCGLPPHHSRLRDIHPSVG